MTSALFSDEAEAICKEIGSRLQSFRINEMNETQVVMAKRVGVSRRTYVRMEAGDPTVKIGFWLEAAMITRTMDSWRSLFTIKQTLFDELASASDGQKQRRRASASRNKGKS